MITKKKKNQQKEQKKKKQNKTKLVKNFHVILVPSYYKQVYFLIHYFEVGLITYIFIFDVFAVNCHKIWN